MQAVAERQVMVDLAVHVVLLGRVAPLALVVVRRAVDQQDRAALRHGLAVVLDVLGDVAGLRPATAPRSAASPRRRSGCRSGSATDRVALVGKVGQGAHGVADQLGGGLVAGAGEQVDVAEHLVAGERAGDAGVVLELGVDELGHHVVGRILHPPVEVLAEAALAGGVAEVS